MVVLLHYRIISILFAVERIFRIGSLLAKLQAKWFNCFTCRDANVPAFGGIFPLYNRFSAIPSGNDEIPLFTDFLAQVSR